MQTKKGWSRKSGPALGSGVFSAGAPRNVSYTEGARPCGWYHAPVTGATYGRSPQSEKPMAPVDSKEDDKTGQMSLEERLARLGFEMIWDGADHFTILPLLHQGNSQDRAHEHDRPYLS